MDWNSTLENIWNYFLYLIGGIFTVGTFVWVFRVLRGWKKDKKAIKLNHSKELVKELKIMADSEVVFSSDNTSFKLNIKSKPNEWLSNLSYKDYSKEVNAHIEDSTYNDERNLIKCRDFYINEIHNCEVQGFLKDLNLKIMDELTQIIPDIPEWNEWSEQSKPIKYYTNCLKSDIGESVLLSYKNYY